MWFKLFMSENCYNFVLAIKPSIKMARPIKETPILFGSDGRRFEERMQNPPKVSPEKRAQIRRSYETVIKMMVN